MALFLTESVFAGEVLQHLSDETDVTPVVSQPVKADRRITYRVLCAPGDDLPDCEQPVDDAEANQSVHEIAVPDMPPDAADLAEAEEKTPAITETKPMPANKAVANKGGKTPRAVKPATEKNKKKTVKAPTAKKPVSKKTDKKKNK